MSRPKNRSLLVTCLVLGTIMTLPLSAQKWARYGPGTRTQASAVYDPATNSMFSFAGQHAPTNIDFNDMWKVSNVIPSSAATQENLSWIRVSVSGKQPGNRFGQSGVYNASNGRFVTFGGGTGFPGPCINELWLITHLNGVGGSPLWAKQAPTGTLPAVREGHTAVFDTVNNKMIVYGGSDCNGNFYNDLWILSNADGSTGTPSWSQVTPIGTGPSARTQAVAIYDSVNNVMTVFGGGNTGVTVYNDVWTLTNANGLTGTPTWTQLSPKGTAPAARVGMGALYDATNNRMTIFGGSNNKGSVLNDGWVLTFPNNIGGTPAWSKITFSNTAPNRKSYASIYDPVSNNFVIFGGDSQIAQTFTDDHVWILSDANALVTGSTWTEDGPAGRNHTSTVYDVSTDQMVVFGGLQSTGVPLNDVWSSSGVIAAGQTVTTTPFLWTQVFPTGTAPAARYGHTAFYDNISNRMMMFGGATSATACLNDVWLLEDANSSGGTPSWVQETASGTPPSARQNFASAYDSSSNSLIVFGGNNCAGGYLSDVWVLSNANGESGTPTWTKLSPSGVGPTARENATAMVDSVNNVLVLYSGDAGAVGLADVWTLTHADGTGGTPTWKHVVPTGTAPPARTGATAIYDSTNNRMVIYGGTNNLTAPTIFYGDTWVLTFANDIGGTPAWISEKVTGTAPQLRFHNAFYNSANNDMVVFGGLSQIAPAPYDDRVFILSVANDL